MSKRKVLQLAAVVLMLVTGCAKHKSEEASPPPGAVDAPPGGHAKVPVITAAECEAQSGEVVGDIGDGAIYRADYTCASGKRPVGAIEPAAGEPIAIEGSICCPT
jgi:hypothetical protein